MGRWFVCNVLTMLICLRVIKAVIDGIVVNDKVLSNLYSHNYLTGSHWDRLQVGTERQEFDVNVCFEVSILFQQHPILTPLLISA